MKFNLSAKLAAVAAVLGGIALPFVSHAAADATLVNAAGDLSTAMKDNVLGTIFSTATLTILAVIVVGFGVIAYVTRFIRKHTGK
jgi:hypothetical protein